MCSTVVHSLKGFLPFRQACLRFSKSFPIPEDLRYVVDNTKQIPLDIDLAFASESKSIKTKDRADMGKGRFGNSQT
jgi:hypothetical protein